MLLSPAEVETLDRAAHSNDKLVLDLLQIIARIKVVYRIDDIRARDEVPSSFFPASDVDGGH